MNQIGDIKNTEQILAMANLFWSSRVDAERRAITFLFAMNGSGVVGVLALLGSLHDKLKSGILLFLIVGVFILVVGVLNASILMLRVMLTSTGIANSLYAAAYKSLSSTDINTVLNKHLEYLSSPACYVAVKKEWKHIVIGYLLFCFSAFCILSGIISVKYNNHFWLLVVTSILLAAVLMGVYFYLNKKLDLTNQDPKSRSENAKNNS